MITRGPWSVLASAHRNIFYVTADTGHVEIAVIYPDHKADHVANAQLIAQAPALLEALKGAVQCLRAINTLMNVKDHGNYLPGLDAIIARAERHEVTQP
jgi:hypothetical protein